MSHLQFQRPAITIGREEHRQLLIAAMIAPGHSVDDSDFLHDELDRAALVPDASLPRDVARTGSRVTYRVDDGPQQTAILAYPGDAEASASRVSVTSPAGAALIGLRAGQSIARTSWDGKFTRFTVLAVEPPKATL